MKIDRLWLIAIIGSICGVIGFWNEIVLTASFMFGWFVVPYFPIDLMIGFVCFFIGLFALFFVPFFTVRHLKKQANMNLEAADNYIGLYQSEASSDITD